MEKDIRVPNISDKEYYTLSRIAYQDGFIKDHLNRGKPIKLNDSSYWYVEKVKKDSDTGLDAVIFSQSERKNGKWSRTKTPNNVVVAFAGTDAMRQPIQDVLQADGGNIVMGHSVNKEALYLIAKNERDHNKTHGKYVGSPSQDALLSSGRYKLIRKATSQIGQSDAVVAKVKKDYKGTKAVVSATGHSLGGAEAEYSGVNNHIYAVSFNSPSIVKLHDKETQKNIKNGDFDHYIKSYINPDDMIGSGWLLEYERHNGTTIYTKDPSASRQARMNRLDPVQQGGVTGVIGRLITDFLLTEAMRMPDTHGLNDSNFKFDNNGNIINSIKGDHVYNKNLDSMTSYSNMDGQTIKVDAEYAKRLAEKLNMVIEDLKEKKKHIERFPTDHSKMVYDLKNEYGSKIGASPYENLDFNDLDKAVSLCATSTTDGTPLFYDTDKHYEIEASLHFLIRDLEEISEFIVKMGRDFKNKDNELAQWLRY
ncbi:lipase [Bacillus atrophaeus]|uniref:lipase n=1 Tax=Bacillus atrophaeus TaxID=1452 RepID=UPI00227F63ED|nr:lipase [Bacillus atrophaeus]MCY7948676.1 lipase [Bacillus atrophaeus]MCY8098385.1 lipase [Bacillus atrophaeus]MCY9169916.1 lipase [Bacillus atrophaeus]MEC0740641.1 lipase [Bacillus atrophaeus]MEC0747095.1 lipase [Bacillus atrophaeus]